MYNEYAEDSFYESDSNGVNILKVFNFKVIIFILLTFVISSQSFLGINEVFPYIFLGLAGLFNIPLIFILIPSLIGISIANFSILSIVNLIIFFIVFSIISVIINIKGVSIKYANLIKLAICFFILGFFNFLLVDGVDFTDVLNNTLLLAILYIIFSSGILVLFSINKGYVYSDEERLSMLVLLTFTLFFLNNFKIFDISLFNIVITSMILIYSYKSGYLFGAVSGFIIGLIISIISDINIINAVIYAASGLAAGLLNKYGKLPIIIGYLITTVFISYSQNITSEILVRIVEIIIASFPIIFMPKVLERNLDKFFNYNNKFGNYKSNLLGCNKSSEKKIQAVTDVLDDLSYFNIEDTDDVKKETRDIIKKYLVDYIENNCIDCENRMKCLKEQSLDSSIHNICYNLENGSELTESMLEFTCTNKTILINHINEIYNSLKVSRIIKKSEKDMKNKVFKQYKEISNILKSLNSNINGLTKKELGLLKSLRHELRSLGYTVYQDELDISNGYIEYVFLTDILNDIESDKRRILKIVTSILNQNMKIKLIFNLSKENKSKIKLISSSKYDVDTNFKSITKSKEIISGDYNKCLNVKEFKYMSILSDGSGSGDKALINSKKIVSYIETLVNGGFKENTVIDILNSIIKIRESEDIIATLDMLIIDKQNLNMESIKFGAAPTYIVNKGEVKTISNTYLPTGIIEQFKYIPVVNKLEKGSIVVQVSDGVIRDNMKVNDNYFINYLKELSLDEEFLSSDSFEILHDLKRKIYEYFEEEYKDDVTVIVHKIV